MPESSVLYFFREISKIPRGSGNEKEISDWLVKFAEKRGLHAIQDRVNNVIIKKPGTPGHENAGAVIVQAHMDMVCEKNADKIHNFLTDPIGLITEGDTVRADGTTLGADNGIGLCMALALLDSKEIAHPPVEALFTVDEETGMSGARELDASLLSGQKLINLDMEDESAFCVSCAGGLRAEIRLPVERVELPGTSRLFKLQVKGLKGGHSGGDIDKGRANANRLLGRVLSEIYPELDMYAVSLSGGMKTNAIPREAEAVIAINPGDAGKAAALVESFASRLRDEYRARDPLIKIEFSEAGFNGAKFNGTGSNGTKFNEAESNEAKYNGTGSNGTQSNAARSNGRQALSKETGRKAIAALCLIPSGIQEMRADFTYLPETSNNLGVVRTNEGFISFACAIRSSIAAKKYAVRDQMGQLAGILGASLELGNEYPGWEYDPSSALRIALAKAYKESFGREPEIEATHGGLECGLFTEKMPGVDMVSFGPNIFDAHSPSEHFSVSSVERVWAFFTKALAKI